MFLTFQEQLTLCGPPSILVIPAWSQRVRSPWQLHTRYRSSPLNFCFHPMELLFITHPEVAYPRVPCPVVRIIKGWLEDVSG